MKRNNLRFLESSGTLRYMRLETETVWILELFFLHQELKNNKILLSVIRICQHVLFFFLMAASENLTIYISPVCSLSYQQ